LLVALSLIGAPTAAAQTPAPVDFEYYSETGHNVTEPFLTFLRTTGGVARYGYPITEAYPDPKSGLLIQYFQRARLEWHPGNPDPYKIQLGLLGDDLGKREPPILVTQIPPASDPSCHYFAETGHTACHKFLDYWKTNGGLDQFGFPISEPKIENGRIVQYFQRARLEWHPEKPESLRVQPALLGSIYYEFAKLDPGRLRPVAPISGRPVVVGLNARGTVANGVIARGATQTAYVWVTDQLGNPLSGAAVNLIVHYPSGNQSFSMLPTNSQGTTSVTFPAGKFAPGTLISMEFMVNYLGLSKTTRSSYLLWFN